MIDREQSSSNKRVDRDLFHLNIFPVNHSGSSLVVGNSTILGLSCVRLDLSTFLCSKVRIWNDCRPKRCVIYFFTMEKSILARTTIYGQSPTAKNNQFYIGMNLKQKSRQKFQIHNI